MTNRTGTHLVEIGSDAVTKRYRSWSLGQPVREWRALKLLDAHVPGVAPVPLRADLAADPPSVTMSRLAGVPVDSPAVPGVAEAVARTVARIHAAIPLAALAELPVRAGSPVELLREVRAGCAAVRPFEGGPRSVARALDAGADWAARTAVAERLARPVRPVFGSGDGNLANYLWDGTGVGIVDFEYAGRSDRAFELAEIVEHISVQTGGATRMTLVLELAELEAAEAARLRDCRRLLALFWLLRILPGPEDPAPARASAATRQAGRLLGLL